MAMLGIWFNNDDFSVRGNKYDDLELLMRSGFTDLFILIKGVSNDVRNNPATFPYTDRLFREGSRLGFRTHGVFICSADKSYTERYPERTDVNLFGIRKRGMINHLDDRYRYHMTEAILTAAELLPMDGIQLDHLRFRHIVNGWSPDEEDVYASYGVRVDELKNEMKTLYDIYKPDRNLASVIQRFEEGDPQLIAFSEARRSILRDFTGCITQELRRQLPDKELSIAMMPAGLEPAKYSTSVLYYGQDYRDLLPLADHLFPMAYASSFDKGTDWIGEISRAAARKVPGAVIGLECDLRTGSELLADLNIIRGQAKAGISLFRYGRMVLALRDGEDTLLYNTYPGAVTRLILKDGTSESVTDCSIGDSSTLRIKGHYDLIRPFGSFTDHSGAYYEGELCIAYSDALKSCRSPGQDTL